MNTDGVMTTENLNDASNSVASIMNIDNTTSNTTNDVASNLNDNATNNISDNVATNNMDVDASGDGNQRWIKNKDYFRLDGKNSNDQRKKMIEKFNDENDRELV